MFETIAELFVYLLCQYPGAFIRRALFRKRSFDDFLKDDWDANFFAVMLFIVAIVLIFHLFA
jgi:hypothetical protein